MSITVDGCIGRSGMEELSNAAIERALSLGLQAQRVISAGQKDWDGRSAMIESKSCQIIRTRYHVSDQRYPEAVCVPLYLPRTDWPDFMVYVVRQTATQPRAFYIIPRDALSKDTSLSPGAMDEYRDAWKLLKETPSPYRIRRRFEVINWQLRDAMDAAKQAGLWSALIRRRNKRWPIFMKTSLIIVGRTCSLHSLTRRSQNPNDPSYRFVAFRRPKASRAEFHLYLLRTSGQSTVYVFPRGSISAATTLSVDHERLAFHKNNWDLLSRDVGKTDAIAWAPKIQKPPKEAPPAVQAIIAAAGKRGLLVELWQLSNNQAQLHISQRRCQVMQGKPIVGGPKNATGSHTYVHLNLPKSDWAEFLIFFVRPDSRSKAGDFYIVPRDKLKRRTVVSPTSSWLREYADAWHLLAGD